VSLNAPENSASPGDFLVIFGTGLGPSVSPRLPDGSPATADPPVRLLRAIVAGPEGNVILPSFAGRAPGLAGVDQINVQVTPDAREGCAVPLLIRDDRLRSQPVLVSVRSGGGPCVDPPLGSLGQISWRKVAVVNTTPTTETNTFTASFPASPGKRPPTPGLSPPAGGYLVRTTPAVGPSCPVPGYTALDAGTITLGGPGLAPPVRVRPMPLNGQLEYTATLPAGSIQSGAFTVSTAGGSAVGSFQSGVRIGAGIQLTSQFPPGTLIRSDGPLTVSWTGGQADSLVTVRLIEHEFLQDYYFEAHARASTGSVTFSTVGIPRVLPLRGRPDVEIVVEVGPDPSQDLSFSAPGLTLGGQQTWTYEYRFSGLRTSGNP